MPVAYNQQTGEAKYLGDNNTWVDAKVAKNDKGEAVAYDGKSWVPVGQTKQPGLMDKLKDRFGEAVKSVGLQAEGKQTGLETGGQILGKTVIGGAGDIAGSALSALTPGFIKKGAEGLAKSVLSTDLGKMGLVAAQKGVEAYQEWANNNPRVARDLESAVDLASVFPVGRAAKAGVEGLGAGLEGLTRGLDAGASALNKRNLVGTPAKQAAKEAAAFNPLDILREHGASMQASKVMGETLSNNMRAIAGKDVVAAPDVRAAASKLIASIAKDPLIANRPKVIEGLSRVLRGFNKNGEMAVSDAMSLKELSNEYFNVAQGAYKSEWGEVAGAAQKVLDRYSSTNPEFKEMMELRRHHYANDVGEAYRNNDFLKGLFSEQDLKNVEKYDQKILREVGTDTARASGKLLDKIKTPEEYAAIRRGITDPVIAQRLDDAIVKKLLPGRSELFWRAARSGSVSKGNVIEGILRSVAPEVSMTPEEKSLLNAVRNSSVSSTRYNVGESGKKAEEIMRRHSKRAAEEKARDDAMRPDINYQQFDYKANQLGNLTRGIDGKK